MNEHFNELTPAEAERLALLLEEMGEAQQIIGKILRHGYYSFHPKDETETANAALLAKEIGDVQAALKMMFDAKDISKDLVNESKAVKLKNVKRYLHHQEGP